MLISIIIPVFNEVNLVCDQLRKVMALQLEDGMEKEIIVVDDGSSDGTHAVIESFIQSTPDTGIRLVKHARNRGKGAAVKTGFEFSKGEILIIQDADLEYDPEEIPSVAKPISEGRAEVVYGSRILMEKALGRSGICGLITGKHPHSYVLAYLGGVTITKFVNLICRSSLTDEPTCYKCFRREVLKEISIESDDFAWEPEVTVKILNQGITIHEVPISYHPRKKQDGKKIKWRDGVKALWTVWRFR